MAAVATVAVVLATLAPTASAEAQAGATGAAAQEPPSDSLCLTKPPDGWLPGREFTSEVPGQACLDCLSAITSFDVFVDAARLTGFNVLNDCLEVYGTTAYTLWKIGPGEPLPPAAQAEPAPALPPDKCDGWVSNASTSEIPVDALFKNGRRQQLLPGQDRAGEHANPIVGYQIPYEDIFFRVQYTQLETKEPLGTYTVNGAYPQEYALDPCHGAYIIASAS